MKRLRHRWNKGAWNAQACSRCGSTREGGWGDKWYYTLKGESTKTYCKPSEKKERP